MPGYLGTQQEFNARYTRPISQSRDAKANSTEAEAGTRALETLHKLILPFTMRRLKSEVLKELPPKIVQDYYCELTNVQTELYTAFSQSVIKGALGSGDKSESTSAFKILSYLRKLIDHPCMVLNDGRPWSESVRNKLQHSGTKLTDVSLSGKFLALQELLYDCGIGVVDDDSKKSGSIISFLKNCLCFIGFTFRWLSADGGG
jgi:TATA-binding protein-associated factor